MAAHMTAVWVPRGNADNEGDLFGMVIGRDRNGGYVVLDVRPDVERAEFHGKTPEAALDAFVNYAEAHYPEGTFHLEVGPNAEGIRPQKRVFETQVKFHIDKFGEKAGWGSLGLTGLGLGLLAIGVTAPAGAVLIAAAALGVEASAAALAGHNADPETTEKQFVIDGMQLLASAVNLRALSDLAKLAMQVPKVAKTMIASEFVLNAGSIGMIAPEWVEEFVAVQNDLSLSDSERNTRLTKILLNVALQSGFLWLAKRGAQQELKQVIPSAEPKLAQVTPTVASHEPSSTHSEEPSFGSFPPLIVPPDFFETASPKALAAYNDYMAEARAWQKVAEQRRRRLIENPPVRPTPLSTQAKTALAKRVVEDSLKIRKWIDDHREATEKLTPALQPDVSYHVTTNSKSVPSIIRGGLLSNVMAGKGQGFEGDAIWFQNGQPFYQTGYFRYELAFAIPTNRLLELGGSEVNHQHGNFHALSDDVWQWGIPFEELAIVMPAGNGYVVPIYIPSTWTGPAFPVHPLWKPGDSGT